MALPFFNKQTVYLASEIFPKDKQYKAEIQKVEGDRISLELSSLPLEIPAGTAMTCYLWDEKMIFSFDTVTLTAKSYFVTVFQIRKPAHIRKKFKRNYERINVKLKSALFNPEGGAKELCFITDLSAGGAKTVARTGKVLGSAMLISFKLPTHVHFEKIGIHIVRERKIDENLSEYGFEFSEISKIRQDKLNDFVMATVINEETRRPE